MKDNFYLKTSRGFEKITILDVDIETEMIKIVFYDGMVTEVPHNRIVQLEIHPINIIK